MPQYIPLRGPGASDPKAPAVKGWADASYRCTREEALAQSDWIGMRADGLVIVDCDSLDAAQAWSAEVDTDVVPVRTTTPRGVHFYYIAKPGSPTGPAVGVREKVDIRAGRGSYVVCPPTPGYTEHEGALRPFDPSWVPSFTRDVPPADQGSLPPDPSAGWDKVPEGHRNSTLAAFAGTLRKQGMAPREILRILGALNTQYCDPPLEVDEVRIIAKSVGRYEPDPDVRIEVAGGKLPLIRASALGAPPAKTWLWEPYVPDCTMTLISGREGIGKGLFCAYLAAAVTNGVAPGTGEKREKRPVLWLTAEDHPHLDVWPRLRAAGWAPGESEDVIFMDMKHHLVLPEDMEDVEDAIAELSPGLVIMDPGRSFFGRRDAQGRDFSYNNEADIRPALQSLLHLSAEHRMPVVFVAHWKKGEGDVKDMTSGSIAWLQIPRHVLDFAVSPDDQEHAFWVGKSNGGQRGYVRAYDIDPVDDFDTARFALADALPYKTLGDWLKAMKEKTNDVDQGFVVEEELEQLAAGAALPSVKELALRTSQAGTPLGERKVKAIIDGLVAEGRVTDGKPRRWVG